MLYKVGALMLVVAHVYSVEKLDITTLTEVSDIVVYGEVESLQFVWRADLTLKRTTDVTIRIGQLYKGEANQGEDRITFMINGGRGVDPETGKDLVLEIPHQAKFKVGESVLLFIHRDTNPNTPVNRRHPYGGLSVGNKLRKRIVSDNEVEIPYTTLRDDGSVDAFDKPITLPLPLVAKVIEAAIENADSTIEVENSIRAFAKTATRIASSKFTKPNAELLRNVESRVDAIIERAKNER